MKKSEEKPDTIFSVRCFIDGKRKLTHQLTRKQADVFRIAALHLSRYLKKEYKLK